MTQPRFRIPDITQNDLISAKLALSKLDQHAARAARDVARRQEEWVKAVSARVLPRAICRAVNRHGLKVPPFVANWMQRHVALRQGPKGRLQYVLDGNVVAETVIEPPRIYRVN